MQQIVNITHARNNLSSLVKKVARTKESVVIVQDSAPSVVIVPYEKTYDHEEYKKKLLSIKDTIDLRAENKQIRREIEKRLAQNEL